MKRAGFTMIELIFVIVILGILAAVAIPKLAATRDDAKISSIIGNARTLIGDITAKRTALGQNGMMGEPYTGISSVPAQTACTVPPTPFAAAAVLAGTSALLCDTTIACVTVALDGNASQITVTTAAAGASTVCDGVRDDPAIQAYVTGSPLDIGGSQVVR
ncbi:MULTISPECIES: prepilin-type N-terminal cleavage/methylation domain-containing protein [Sulfurimonas]|uniref:Prepilin-type N-terminal cleavage/methylation domain-containing protein n=1 Tax=Sulfurimonas diazotrophicus TaxID=3131939 RepID=A0ABZ3HDZ3_9BACT